MTLFVALAPLLFGCDAGARTDQPTDEPPLRVQAVLAATGLTSDGGLDFQPLDPRGTSAVLSTTSFKIQVDRLLSPVTATRQALCVQPLLGNVVNLNDCTAGIFFEPSYDPVRREVTYRQQPENGVLNAADRYQLTAYVAIAPTDTGLRSFDGIPLEFPVQIEFTVLPDPNGVVPPYEPLPLGDHWANGPDPTCSGSDCVRSVKAIFSQVCSGSGCHGTMSPSEGMSLASPAALLATAINRAAHETQMGEHAATPDTNPARFGRAMAILEPRVPGDSYLLYKLLANRNNAIERPFDPDPSGDPNVDPPEVRRLRQSVVVGMPMPPSTNFLTLNRGELEWISEWLIQGAPLPSQ